MVDTKLTEKAKEYIKKNAMNSNRWLKDSLKHKFGIDISHVAIGRFKKQYLETIVGNKTETYQKAIPGFPEFMKKLELSDSYSAKRLKEKLNVQGKSRQINLDRVLRIIQYTLDIVKE